MPSLLSKYINSIVLRLISFFAIVIPLNLLAEPINKIVSLDLCSDWLLVKYAEKTQIAALSSYIIRYPQDWVGTQWPTHDGSLEEILALKPTLVITGEYNAPILRERLKSLGIPIKILKLPKQLSDIVEYEKQFLLAIGQPVGMASKPSIAGIKKEKTVLLIGANGVGTGLNTIENDVLHYAGWHNYLNEEGYISLDLEQLVSNPPDAILWSAPGSNALANLFSDHPVLKKSIPPSNWMATTYWYWQCPGPWTWQLVDEVKQWQIH